MVVQNIVWVHHAIRCIVVTWRVEDIVLVFQLNDSDVARSLHDSVIHVLKALTGLHELVLLISIVQRRTECQVLHLVRTTSWECIFLIAVSTGGDDTIVADLRERYKVVTLVSCTIERYTVRVTETSIEEVLHIVLDRQIRLDLLRVVIYSTILQYRTIETWTPRTILIVSLVTVPTHTEVVLHLRQAHHALPLQTTVILNTEALLLLLTSLGSNQDHTIGSTATIEGCSGSTLQDGHVLHVVRVHSVSTVTEVITAVQTVVTENCRVIQGHTINNIQRLVSTTQWADTTNNNWVRRTWVTCSRSNSNTGYLTLQAWHHVCSTGSSNLFTVNGSCWITQSLSRTLDTQGSYNHLVEGLGVALQEYAHAVLGSNSLRQITEITDLQLLAVSRQSNVETTIHVSQHTSTCTNHLNGSTDDGLSVFLWEYSTRNFCLSQRCSYAKEHSG